MKGNTQEEENLSMIVHDFLDSTSLIDNSTLTQWKAFVE